MGNGLTKAEMGRQMESYQKRYDLAIKEQEILESAIGRKNLKGNVDLIEESLNARAAFSENTLISAMRIDPKRIEKVLMETVESVFTAVVDKVEADWESEWEWFQKYLFNSPVWVMHTADGKGYLYEEMVSKAEKKSKPMMKIMDKIIAGLKERKSDWNKLRRIRSKEVVNRQDHKEVGLLREKVISRVLEEEKKGGDEEGIEKLKNQIEATVTVSKLCSIGKRIDGEFQDEIKNTMAKYGKYHPGKVKTVDRCQAKLESDYQKDPFPRAAKILDIVRCSITFVTVDELLDGYHGFLNHIKQSKQLHLARVKNGLVDQESGYRDIKINVIFQSRTNRRLRMICEVQLILLQQLEKKKKMHRMYEVTRRKGFYKMVVRKGGDELTAGTMKEINLKSLKFEPVLNLKKDVDGVGSDTLSKAVLNSNLKLMFLKPWNKNILFCVNTEERKVVFKTEVYVYGQQTHHWVRLQGRHYLAVQTQSNCFKFYKVSSTNGFTEDKSLRVTLDDGDDVRYVEYDGNFENMYLVKNRDILEQRTVSGGGGVVMNIKLESKMTFDGTAYKRSMSISKDGILCALAAGNEKSFWYLINISQQKQFKITSKTLSDSCTACFLNDNSGRVVIGGVDQFEIWNVKTRSSERVVTFASGSVYVRTTFSVGNILAVGADYKMHLFDTRSFESIFSKKYDINIHSLQLTSDLKHLVMAGFSGEMCIVFNITH